MTTLTQKIASAHYVANEQTVEQLAHDRYVAASGSAIADGVYLRIIIVAMQAKLGKGRRGRLNTVAQAEVLEQTHARFYPPVLRGVTTPDIAHDETLEADEKQRRSLERNSRSAFARSAKSTLASFIAGGGDVRGLDVNAVTKDALRKAVAPPEPEDKVDRQISRSEGALMRAFKRKARGDPAGALTAVEAFIEQLQGLFETEPEPGQTTTVVGAHVPREGRLQRSRAGTPQLHRGA